MNKEAVLQMSGISKSFSSIQVLRDISLTLYPGEVHCLVGENGAGKSTLIKIISGAYFPDAGTITYLGQSLREIAPRWARENGISTIYQEIDLALHLNAVENIMLGVEPCTGFGNINKKTATARAAELFKKLDVDIPLNISLSRLRLAEQQTVAIAKALHLNSKVMIFDEPTSVFTNKEIDVLFRIINDLKSEGMAILYISHHMDEIFQLGDRITVLRDGELIHSKPIADFTKETLIQAMVGRNIEFKRSENTYKSDEVVLEVKNLSAGKMVKDVSFVLHRGEILGFGGLVGAGRTEVMRALIGADKLDSGEVSVFGKRTVISNPRQSLQMGIGMLPENRTSEGIVAERPVKDNITYALIEKTSRMGLIAWRKINAAAVEMVDKMTVRPPDPHKLIRYLSGGNQQKVILGKLLLAECDIVILDEPTRGVDVGARTEIYSIIREMVALGKSVILISSDMTELLTQSDRIIVMCEGTVTSELDGAEATEEKVLSSALKSSEKVMGL
ncbi:MAG: sugar ABC transporter ATP-binding protein [Synergistaceae bacterium]|jgi:ribose transport system ATP-binding protein|nr:sugar ABC transporter ATP-binding protein [Synergistaceae bacterium]